MMEKEYNRDVKQESAPPIAVSDGAISPTITFADGNQGHDNKGDVLLNDGFDNEDDLTLSQDGDHSNSDKSMVSSHSSSAYRNRMIWMYQVRACAIFSIVFLSVFLPIIIYCVAYRAQTSKFEAGFSALADQVVAEFELNLRAELHALDALSIAATSQALHSNDTWPFVTIRDFDLQGASAKKLAGTLSIGFVPMVTDQDRREWEDAYVTSHINWLWNGMNQQASVGAARTRSLSWNDQYVEDKVSSRALQSSYPDFSKGFSNKIYTIDIITGTVSTAPNNTGPYFPEWQTVPLSPFYVNFDILTLGRDGPFTMLQSKQAVISRVENWTNWNPASFEFIRTVYSQQLQAYFHDPNVTYGNEPVTNMYYPVFDTFGKDRTVVATFFTQIFWQTFFLGLLPEGADGIICVVENACGDVFTYQVDGTSNTFLGLTDAHDRYYDNLEVVYDFASIRQSDKFSFSETAAPLNVEFCPYTMRVYPSNDLRSAYVTIAPVIYATSTAAFFILIGLILLSYDFVVQRRMKFIVQSEKEAEKIVSDFFPKIIRDRLLGSKHTSTRDGRSDQDETPFQMHPKTQLKTFLSDDDLNKNEKGKRGVSEVDDYHLLLNTQPIADLFPFCTVLFADIAGFSAWSSEREPEQVFTLLENVFQAFDKLAHKRKVFKVETIGDCYVAVTGLPGMGEIAGFSTCLALILLDSVGHFPFVG